jgi:hypothetical protein
VLAPRGGICGINQMSRPSLRRICDVHRRMCHEARSATVNAKTLGCKDAKGREMGRERPARINQPVGEAAQEPKSLRLGTFAPLR